MGYEIGVGRRFTRNTLDLIDESISEPKEASHLP
jgi:hypothetical protein